MSLEAFAGIKAFEKLLKFWEKIAYGVCKIKYDNCY